jgi:photosystem II stability/assembly factor-like uncharacterized protein
MKKSLLVILFFLPLLLKAQWQECPTPYHGGVSDLETFDNYIWAGTLDGGVYRTTNQQADWTSMNSGLSSIYDRQVYTVKAINGSLYVGCRGGLYKKASANASWVQLRDIFHPVKLLTGSSSVLISGEYGDVTRSTDGGVTWQSCNTGLPSGNAFDVSALECNPTTGEFILGISTVGIYHSTNQGLSWSLINYPAGAPLSTTFISMIKRINNTIYLGLENDGLYSWDSNNGVWQFIYSCPSRITDLIITNGHYIVTSSYGAFYAPLTGGSFNYLIGNAPSFLPPILSLEQSNDVIYLGGQVESVYTIDSLLQTYSEKKQGMKASPIEFLSGNGTSLLSHSEKHQYLWHSTNEFTTAQSAPTSNLQWELFTDEYHDAQHWYIVGNAKGIQLSTDQGQHFHAVNNGLPASAFLTYNMQSICSTGAGYLIAGSRDSKFYRSLNDTTWTLLSSLASSNESINHIIKAGNYLFAGTREATTPASPHIYISSDNGLTWQILPGPFQNSRDVFGLVYDGSRLIAGSSGYGTFASSDFGQTWSTINDGFSGVQMFKCLATFNGETFAASQIDNKLYRLSANDTTWQCLTPGANDPHASVVYYQANTLFVGTVDNGIWKWPNYVTGISEKEKITCILFPNPSRSSKLKFPNGYAAPLTVTVTDITGKEVFTEQLKEGRTEMQLDGSIFSKGVYTIRLRDHLGQTGSEKWLIQ